MGRSRKLIKPVAWLSAFLLATITVLTGPVIPAQAVVVDPFTLDWSGRVHGSFLQVGNGVLRCVGGASGQSSTWCQNLHSGNTTLDRFGYPMYANDYANMQYVDIDGVSNTINSSSATITIPAGATVAYARLFWGGSTGYVKNYSGNIISGCSAHAGAVVARPTIPKNRVSLSFGGNSYAVTGAVTEEVGSQVANGDYVAYTGDAVVTDLLRGLTTGSQQTITVGNVWAPTGNNCFGGWGLDVVYDHGAFIPGIQDSTLKEVYQFGGHTRIGGSDREDITLTGLNPQGTGAKAGVIAYEGDAGITGDYLRYQDPSTWPYQMANVTGSTSNMWIGYADGAVTYNSYNTRFVNANVDVYTRSLPDLAPGDSSMTLRIATEGDSYLLHNVIVAVPIAAVEVVKTSADGDDDQVILPGETPSFKITVYNTGAVDLVGLVATDNVVANCSRTVGSLAAGASTSWTCTGPPTSDRLVNSVTVNGRTGTGIAVSADDTTEVLVAKVEITKTPKSPDVPRGTAPTWVIRVRNTGSADVRNVTVSDPLTSSCNRTFATLAAGTTQTYECTGGAITAGMTNTANVTGTAGSADHTPKTLTGSASGTVRVADIAVTKTASPTIVAVGQQTTFTITVRNTGEVTLSNVAVEDPSFPAECSRQNLGSLVAGATTSYTCTVTVNGPVTNTARASGTPPSGNTVSATASAPVATKGLRLTKNSSTADTNNNGYLDATDRVTYTFEVTNTGSTALTNLALSDPMLTNLSCPATTLAPGATITCTAGVYTVTHGDVQTGSIINAATIRAEAPGGNPADSGDDVVATDTEVLTPSQRPAFILTKTANPTSVSRVGQLVTYTFVVTNTGNIDLANVRVTDSLGGVSALSCSPALGSSLPVGQTMTCTATRATTQADLTAGTVRNTASATAVDSKGNTLTQTASTTVTGVQQPALTVSKVASQLTFTGPNQTITYTITATNSGNVPLSAVTVRDSRLASLTCTPATPASLAPGASTVCTGSFVTTQTQVDGGAILNTAIASGTGPLGQSATALDDEVITPIASPAISVTKTPSRTSVTAVGQSITYTIVATNSGNQTLTNVQVSDPMTGLSPLTCSPALGSTLAPQARMTCTGTYLTTLTDLNRGSITNTASATGTYPGGWEVSGSRQATVTAVQTPAITVAKTATPSQVTAAGQQVAYRFVITNSGNVTLNQIGLVDALPNMGTVTCTPFSLGGSLAPGQQTICTATRSVTQTEMDAGGVTNTATASGVSPQNVTVQANGSATVTTVAAPAITLSKTASPTRISSLSDEVTYTFEVRNTGNLTLSNVTVTDTRVTGLTCTPSAGSSLVPNGTMTCTATRRATQTDLDQGSILNTATVRSERPGGNPADVSDDIISSDGEVVTVTQSAAIDIEKTTTATGFSKAGDLIPYRFVVRNTGNVTLTSITVSDPVPNLSPITCDVGSPITLAPGAATTCTATKTVTQEAVNAGFVTNTATATGSPPSGANVSDQSTVTVTGTQSPAISIVKTANPTTVTSLNQLITYSFVVTNTGNQTLTDVGVSDPHPRLSTPSCQPNAGSTLAPGGTMTCTATYRVTQDDLDLGSILNEGTARGTSPNLGPVTGRDGEVVSVTQAPRLTLSKTASPERVTTLDQIVTYTFTVTNTGNVTASNVVVTDPMVGLSQLACTPNTGIVAPGDTIVCTATKKVTQSDLDTGSFRNTATVNYQNPAGVDQPATTATTTVNVTQSPKLTLEKQASPTVATSATSNIDYTFVITNTGNVTVSNVQLSDPLSGLTTPTCTPALGSSLSPGASIRCTASRPVTQQDVDDGQIVNTATATGNGANGTIVAPVTSSAKVTITQRPDMSFSKAANPATITAAGQLVTYSFKLVNTGDVTLSSVVVTDPMQGLSGLTCDRSLASLVPAGEINCTATRIATLADMNAGSVSNTATALAELPGGDPNTVDDNLRRQATTTVTATQLPSFSFDKRSDISTVLVAGEEINYTFSATNNGNVTLRNVRVTDPLPGMSALTCNPQAPAATLDPGATITCTGKYTVTQDDVNRGHITNTATVSGTDQNGNPVSKSDDNDVAATRTATMSLVKSASRISVDAVGQTVVYNFIARNTGNVTLTNVQVSDSLPGLSAVVCTPAAGSSLLPGAEMSCTATRSTTQPDLDAGMVKNTAHATAGSPVGGVSADSNEVTVQATQRPAISLTKEVTPTTYSMVGETLSYRIVVTNTGNVTLQDVTVSDSLPLLIGWQCDPAGPATLAPGATMTCTAMREIRQTDLDIGAITNDARVTSKDPSGAPGPTAQGAVTARAVQTSDMTFSKSASPTNVSSLGQIVTYTFTVTNTGNVTLGQVGISDPIPGLSPLTCSPSASGSIAPGGTRVCTGTRAVTQADLNNGRIENTAKATAEKPGGDVNDPSDDLVRTDSKTVTVTQNPAIALTKKSDSATFSTVGQPIVYTFTLENTGNLSLTNVGLTDAMFDPSDIECSTPLGGTLQPRASIVCTATRIVTQPDIDAGSLLNTATATADSTGGPVSASANHTVVAEAAPALDLFKSVSPTTVTAAGQTVTYSFTVSNTGNTTITNISVEDSLPGLGAVVCDVPQPFDLAPDQENTCRASYTVRQQDVDAGGLSNTATATGTDSAGDPISDTDTSSFTANSRPSIDIEKTASIGSFATVGTRITFYKRVTNTGNVTLRGLVITDPLVGLTQLGCGQTTLAPGEWTLCTGEYTTTQADIDSGSVANQASAEAFDPRGQPIYDEDSLRIPATQDPAISLTKVADPRVVSRVGEIITYTYRVKNEGNVTLSNVLLSDPMPGLTGWICHPTGPVPLAPGETKECSANYTVTQADLNRGTIENTATTTSRLPDGTAMDPHSAHETVTVTQTPGLTVTKAADVQSVTRAGQVVNYTINVLNSGNVDITNVQVSDPLVTGLTCHPVIGSRLEAGATMSCTGSHTVTQDEIDAGGFTNRADATGVSPAGNVSGQGDATVTVTRVPGITLTKSADRTQISAAGQNIRYTFVAENTGNVTLRNVTITDPLPRLSQLSCDASAPVSLAPGGKLTCTADYVTDQADVDNRGFENTATVTSIDPLDNNVSDTDSQRVTATLAPTLSLTKSVTPGTVTTAGTETTYEFVATNTGNTTITNVRVTDPVADLSEISCTPAQGSTLLPGESLTCTASRTVTQTDINHGSVPNTAQVTGDGPAGTPVAPAAASRTVTVQQAPGLSITKSVDKTTVSTVGERINYEIVVTNTGNVTMSNVFVSDNLPGLQNWSCDKAGTVPLAPGETKTCTAWKEVTQTDLDAGSILNTARVTSNRPDGSPHPAQSASQTVTVIADTGMTFTKSADVQRVQAAGDTIVYTFEVKNTSTITLRNVQIDDQMPGLSDLTCTPALGGSLAPNQLLHCTATKQVTATEMDAPRLINTATATATAANGTQLSESASAVVVPVHKPALRITKSVDKPTFATVGTVLTYTFLVQNTGNALVENVALVDTLPGLSPATCSRPAPVTLDVNESMTCTATYTVDQTDLDRGWVTNSATATATDPNGDPIDYQPGETTSTAEQNPQLQLTKSSATTLVSAVGETLVFFFDVSNTGNVTVSNVKISDDLAGLGALTCTQPEPISLAPGGSVRCWAEYKATQADFNSHEVYNLAVAGGTRPDGTELTPPQQGRDEISIPTDSRPGLTTVKTASPMLLTNIGETIHYTLRAENTGNETLVNVVPRDLKIEIVGLNCDRQFPATLQPGESITCKADYTPTRADFDQGEIENSAETRAATLSGQPIVDHTSVKVDLERRPHVTFQKTPSTSTVSAAGETVTYFFSAVNDGTVTATITQLTDGLTGLGALTCSKPLPVTLAVGDRLDCSAPYQVTQDDINAGSILNTASLTGTTPLGALPPTTSDTTVTAQQNPAVTFAKSANRGSVTKVDDPIIFTFKAKNTGNTTIRNVQISDELAGLGALSCTPGLGSDLAPQAEMSCTATYLTTHADLEAGLITNRATLTGDASGTPVSETDSATVTAIYQPGLSLTKQVSAPQNWVPGDTITYSFVVTNTGTIAATDVKITDPLPGLSPITCVDTYLEPGARTTCSATYTAQLADANRGFIENRATAGAAEVTGQAFPPSPEATARTSTSVAPMLTLDKRADRTEFSEVGDVIIYTFEVTNTGVVSVQGLTITDLLPGLSALNCPTDRTLDPGESGFCTAAYIVDQDDLDAGSIVNSASVTGSSQIGVPAVPGTDNSVVTATQTPALTIEKQAETASYAAVGDIINYSFRVTNSGNVTLGNVSVTDALAGVTLSGCSASSLQPNGSFTCSGRYAVSQDDLDRGHVSNSARATGTAPGGPVQSEPATATVPAAQHPAVKLTKSADKQTVDRAGETVTYTFAAENIGNVTLSNLRIVDPLPNMSQVTCDVTSIAPGEIATCRATYVVPQEVFDANGVTNTATIRADGPLGDPGSDADDVTASGHTTFTAVQDPALSIEKSADKQVVSAAREVVTYTFRVTNTGDVTVTGLVIEDQMPGVSAAVCEQTALAPAQSTVCTATYSVLQSDVDAGAFTNSAMAHADAPGGRHVESPRDSVTITADQKPSLSLQKSPDKRLITTVGEVVRFTFLGTNTGNVTAHVVRVIDEMPGLSALECTPNLPAILPPRGVVVCTAEYRVTQADLNSGSLLNSATMTAQEHDGKPFPEEPQSDNTVDVGANRQMTLDHIADVTTVNKAGDKIAYTFVARNVGNQTLHELAISDSIPGLQLSCTPTQPTVLNPVEGMVCTAEYTVTQDDIDAGAITSIATLRANGPDGVAMTPIERQVVVTAVQQPHLTLQKRASIQQFGVLGTDVTYTFTVTNSGNVTARNVQVTDPMPGLSDIDCGPAAADPLRPGESRTCTAAYKVTQADLDRGSLTNRATAEALDPQGQPFGAVSETVSSSVVQRPALTVQKRADTQAVAAVGEQIRYTIVVENTGNQTLRDVRVTDAMPGLSNLTCTGAGALLSMAPGVKVTCTASYTVTQTDLDRGSVTNTATARGDGPHGDLTTSNDDIVGSSKVDVGVTQDRRVTLEKQANRTVVAVGDRIEFTLTVHNPGNVTLRTVRLADSLRGLSEIKCDSSGSLAPDATRICKASYVTTQSDVDAGGVFNTASATATGPDGRALPPVKASVTVPAAGKTAATFRKQAQLVDENGNGKADAGETIKYLFVVTNTGSLTATNVKISDPMPGLKMACQQPFDVAPGQSVTCSGEYVVTEADLDAPMITNTATATGNNLGKCTPRKQGVQAVTVGRLTDCLPLAATVRTPTGDKPATKPSLPQTGAGVASSHLAGSILLTCLGIALIWMGARRRTR